MTLSYSDIIITVIIVGVVLWAAHRLGQVNPVGTGKLATRLSAVELKVAEQGTKMDAVEQSVATLVEGQAGTTREVAAMRVEMASDRGLAERTWASVSRIETFFIEDAFRNRKEGR